MNSYLEEYYRFSGTDPVQSGPIKPRNISSDTYAQDMNAYINRSMWEDYKDRYQPVEQQLISETEGRAELDKRLGEISAIKNNSFSSTMKSADRRRGRYGLTQDSAEKAYSDRNNDLSQAVAVADAKNNLRTHDYDRKMDTLSGSASAINQAVRI